MKLTIQKSTKERFGRMAIASDATDLDLQNKIADASDYVVLRLEEFPTVFPTPGSLVGSDKVRLDRITNDLAAALYVEDRSMRARTGAAGTRSVAENEWERWGVVWRRRAMMELDQYIKVKTLAASPGSTAANIPDFKVIEGTGMKGSDFANQTWSDQR